MTTCIEPVTLHRTTTTNIINLNFKLHLDVGFGCYFHIIFTRPRHSHWLSIPATTRTFSEFNEWKVKRSCTFSFSPTEFLFLGLFWKVPCTTPAMWWTVWCREGATGCRLIISQWKINHLNPFMVKSSIDKVTSHFNLGLSLSLNNMSERCHVQFLNQYY